MATALIRTWCDRQAQSIAPVVRLEGRPVEGRAAKRLRKSDMTPLPSTFREPRIAYLAGALGLMVAGTPPPAAHRPTGFALRDLRAFRGEHVDKVKWNLGAISTVCNLDCTFCYRYGSPTEGEDAVVISNGRALLSPDEAQLRLGMVHGGRGLFSASGDLGEDFTNPKILDIYRQIRASDPHEVIETTTHGGFFTEDVVSALADLRPVDFTISLNSSDPDIRRDLMQDRTPEIAINALPLMRRYGLWYSVSIVAWPTVPLSDLRRTILYAEEHQARLIRVQLPGRSRFHPDTTAYDRRPLWDRIVAELRDIRKVVKTPIYWQPYLYDNDPLVAAVAGAIPGSPAAAAGLRPDDVVTGLDGTPIRSREEARRVLRKAGRRRHPLDLQIQRGDRALTLRIDPAQARYPYAGEPYDVTGQSLGIFINQGLDVPSVVDVVTHARERGHRRILVVTSELMKGSVRTVLDHVAAAQPGGPVVDLLVPTPQFFGGDVILGDLLVFEDIRAAVVAHEHTHGRYDEIVIPATLAEAGTDLNGKRFDAFNATLSGRCRLAPHPRILD